MIGSVTKSEIWRKFRTSLLGIFVLQAAMLAVFFTLNGLPHPDWQNIAITCFVLSAISSLFIKFSQKKYTETFGLDSDHTSKLIKAFKTGVIPDDKMVLEALPAYLARRERAILKFQKNQKYYFILFGFMFLTSLLARSFISTFEFVALLGFGYYVHVSLPRDIGRVQKLREELQHRGLLPDADAIDAQNAPWIKSVSDAKKLGWILYALGLVMFIVLTASLQARHHPSSNLPTQAQKPVELRQNTKNHTVTVQSDAGTNSVQSTPDNYSDGDTANSCYNDATGDNTADCNNLPAYSQ